MLSSLRVLRSVVAVSLLASVPACVEPEVEDGVNDAFPSGKADGGIDEGSPEAAGVLRLVNDPAETAASLKSGANVTSRVAGNIIKKRNGADGAPNTSDDDKFDNLAELDAVPYVGPATLNALLARARALGYVTPGASMDVVFSPKPAADSHNARIAKLIRTAKHSLDIAIYSYSDAGIAAALADRVAAGVDVRFIFDTAAEDRKITDPAARASSKSGRLEAMGIDVRYVNKTMHHKLLIVDGPRDEADRVNSTKLVMGSANWSSTAATSFDENTVFIEGSPELAAAYQHEFDKLWKGSRDFVGPAAAQPHSSAGITADDVPDDEGVEPMFTSDNMLAAGADGTTWRVPDKTKKTVTDQWNAAIGRATTKIHIAATHMRLRPFVDALVAKKQANPSIDIKVYLDQQEYISPTGDAEQKAEVTTCLAAATTETQRFNCLYNDFLFSKALVDAGITVKFKSYAYRWDHSYAAQMHSKYMVVDGKEVFTGSWNHSMNSEQDTFENGLRIFGAQNAAIVGKFQENFNTIWATGPTLLAPLRAKIQADATIPIVFEPMALTYQEFGDLRALIRSVCPDVDSTEFRSNASAHRTCTK